MEVFSNNTSNNLLYSDNNTQTKFNLTKINFINKLNEGTVRVPGKTQLTKFQVNVIQKNNLTAALAAIQTQITNL